MTPATEAGQAESLKVRPMIEADLTDADRIMRTAFGTFLGLPVPESDVLTDDRAPADRLATSDRTG